MKRKFGMGVILLLVILPVSGLAQEEQMIVTAEIPSTFILSIPADQAISYKKELTNLTTPLKLTGNVSFEKGVQIEAKVQAFEHQTLDQAAAIPFEIWDEQNKKWMGHFHPSEELIGGIEKNTFLKIKIEKADWEAASPGHYKGSIIFTARIRDKAEVDRR